MVQLQFSFSGFSLVLLAVMAVGCCGAVYLRKSLRPQEKMLCVSALCFPVVFYTGEALLSAWKLWGWYLYALRFSFVGSAALVLIVLSRPNFASLLPMRAFAHRARFALALLAIMLMMLVRTHYRVESVMFAMFAIADEGARLSEFAAKHPGKYAMGDRAGMFGYLSSSPLIQTEGLMMDRRYVEHIRHQDDRLATLEQYNVDYYVQFVFNEDVAKRFNGRCLDAQEPSIAGKDALRMRSVFCAAPVAIFQSRGGSNYVYRISSQS